MTILQEPTPVEPETPAPPPEPEETEGNELPPISS